MFIKFGTKVQKNRHTDKLGIFFFIYERLNFGIIMYLRKVFVNMRFYQVYFCLRGEILIYIINGT